LKFIIQGNGSFRALYFFIQRYKDRNNIALAAASLGLGNVICGMAAIPYDGPKGAVLKEKSGFINGCEFGVAVLVGYATGELINHTSLIWIRYVFCSILAMIIMEGEMINWQHNTKI